jgi:hypothetical protein
MVDKCLEVGEPDNKLITGKNSQSINHPQTANQSSAINQ